MKPIPKKLLIHSARIIQQETTDMWDEKRESYGETLSHIRIEPSHSFAFTKENEQLQLSALLIFDCRNSRPSGFDFSDVSDCLIEHGGKRYRVCSVDVLYDCCKRPHHYEVGLCL